MNLNLGIYKAVKLSRFTLQFRTELFDAFNHANFVVVDSIADIAQSPGLIVARKNDDHRNVQFALKLIF